MGPHLSPIEALEVKLRAHPQVSHRRVTGGLRIEPTNADGFPITIVTGRSNRWVVAFGECGFHEEFDRAADALEFVAFGLSSRCRLRERTGFWLLRKSFVERLEDGAWKIVYEVGTLTAFWDRPGEQVFQNRLI